MKWIVLILGACFLAAIANADSISTDRPGESNSPSVVAPGTVQFEGGLTFSRETDGGDPNTNTVSVPQGLLRIGVLSYLEFRMIADGYVFEDRKGDNDRSSGSDLTLAARGYLFDQKRFLPTTALDFNLSLPTGSDAVTSDGVDPSGTIIFEWVLNERFALYHNLVLASTSLGKGTSGRAFRVTPTASLTAALNERAGAFIEYFATFSDSGLKDEHNVDGGFTWRIGDDLQLDVSAGAGLNAAAPDFYVSVGAAWRFSFR
jgi:hypothetical protein